MTAIWEGFLCVGMVVGLLVLFRRRSNSQGPTAQSDGGQLLLDIHLPLS